MSSLSRIRLTAVAAILMLCVALPAYASGPGTDGTFPPNKPDSTELINHMKVDGDVSKGLFWNGKTITFHGEAIGEVMVRGRYAWIHLNDDAYMERNVEEGAKLGGYNSGMAVWVSADLTKPIDTYGDYQHEGSIVEIEGTFNGACGEHGGDMDIHATSLKVLRAGHRVTDPIPGWKALLALALAAVALLLFWLERRARSAMASGRRR